MADITTRETSGGGATVKGSPLTNAEVDTNFINLNAGKVESGSDATLADVTADSVQFTGGTGTQGTVSWNVDEETLDLILDGATLQMGQEVHYHVRNNTASTITNGTPVMVTGTIGASGRLTIAPMDATDEANGIYYIGVTTEDIAADTDGKVTHFGKLRKLDTSSYLEGDVLWLSTATVGAFTTTEPSTGIKIPAAIVINSHASTGTVFCRYQGSYGLHDLHDFDASVTPVDNDIVAYDATSGTYQPQSAAEAGLATAAQGALADSALQSESDPVFTAHTTSNISDGTGFLKNNGAGAWSYDNSTYLTSYTETDTLDSVTGRGNTTTNAITVGNLTSTGIDDNATSTAITIDANENVGIGGAPVNNGAGYGTVTANGTTGGVFEVTTAGVQKGQFYTDGTDLIINSGAGGGINYRTAGVPRMTLDSSGNVGIGTDTVSASSGYTTVLVNGSTGGQLQFSDDDVKTADLTSNASDLFIQSAGDASFRVGGFGSGNEAMRISSNGQLKIGGTTNSPANVRTVVFGTGNASTVFNTGHTGIHINNEEATAGDGNFGAGLSFGRFGGSSDDQSAAILPVQTKADEDHMGIAFLTHNTNTRSNPLIEAMRITSDGNLLVGKNTTAIETVGINLFGTGRIISTADGDDVAVLNRKTSDGDIAVFKKDGATVGRIGNHTNKLEITGSGSNTVTFGHAQTTSVGAGIYSWHTNNALVPYNSAGHTIPDGVQSLGHGSYRWKDLYLSGGAYLGGTGSANHLDDYEEGAWTMGLASLGGSGSPTEVRQGCTYVKIGNLVNAQFFYEFHANTLSGGTLRITGLPFTVANTTYNYPEAAILIDNLASTLNNPLLQINLNSTVGDFIQNNGGTGKHAGLVINTYIAGRSNIEIRGVLSYRAA